LPSVNWVCQECIVFTSVTHKSINSEIQKITDAVRKLEEGHTELNQKLMNMSPMSKDPNAGQLTGAAGTTSTGLLPNNSNVSSI